jgi:3D-(3,5/4)-trihydroxycyclohexane-1,2-dione acylhydrolase (decyclizing)
VYREFRQITDSTLTQSSVLGVLNETLAADAVIVAAAGSLPGICSASGATGRPTPIT